MLKRIIFLLWCASMCFTGALVVVMGVVLNTALHSDATLSVLYGRIGFVALLVQLSPLFFAYAGASQMCIVIHHLGNDERPGIVVRLMPFISVAAAIICALIAFAQSALPYLTWAYVVLMLLLLEGTRENASRIFREMSEDAVVFGSR